MMGNFQIDSFKSIGEILKYRADITPNVEAYIFIDDDGNKSSITYSQLYLQSESFANYLLENNIKQNDRCILMYHANLELVVGIMACNLIGAIIVPVDMPLFDGEFKKWKGIINNCEASCILTNNDILEKISATSNAEFNNTPVYSQTDGKSNEELCVINDIALLQYTSGSTKEPKGVMVTNLSLINNLQNIMAKLGLNETSRWVSWLPYYHDMGLIAGLLTSISSGCQDIFMSPTSFKKNPIIWLKVISDYKATFTVAPNFAFEILANILEKIENDDSNAYGIRLDSLVRIISGSEPVRFNTLVKFIKCANKLGLRDSAVMGAYGLAEATLCVSANYTGEDTEWIKLDNKKLSENRVSVISSGVLDSFLNYVDENESNVTYLVGNGSPIDIGDKVMVLDNQGNQLKPFEIGEVCVSGESVAEGYWKNEADTLDSFVKDETSGEVILHTGDAGFLSEKGALFITGRFKEIIIIRGVNYYPQDIEQVSYESDNRLNYASCVFSNSSDDEDSLTLIQEVAEDVSVEELSNIANKIRNNILQSFKLSVGKVIFVAENSILRTYSGKIMRLATKKAYLNNTLKNILYVSDNVKSVKIDFVKPSNKDEMVDLVLTLISSHLSVDKSNIDKSIPFMQMGINSKSSVDIISEINEGLEINLEIVDIFNYNTIDTFSEYVYNKYFDNSNDELSEDDIADLLNQELGGNI